MARISLGPYYVNVDRKLAAAGALAVLALYAHLFCEPVDQRRRNQGAHMIYPGADSGSYREARFDSPTPSTRNSAPRVKPRRPLTETLSSNPQNPLRVSKRVR